MTLESMITLELGKLSSRYTNEKLPMRISNLFEMKNHAYNTRAGNSPVIPIHGTKLYNNSY